MRPASLDRSSAGRERDLIILDTGDILDNAFAIGCPQVNAEGEGHSRYRHSSQSSKPQVVAAQVVVALAA